MNRPIYRISWPELQPGVSRRAMRVRPVFLPYAGCPRRCLYCNQERQTGQPAGALAAILAALEQEGRAEQEGHDELAFYGGSFTALPEDWIRRFLALAAAWKREGRIRRVRCSTRPDAVEADSLARWVALGLDVVELGVQSFQDHALAASGRGYDGQRARQACRIVRQAGAALGIQLMPDLPGSRPGDLGRDMTEALALRPDGIRLYPCLVLRGTLLEQHWRQGRHRPRALQAMAWAVGRAVLRCWLAGTPLWRIGMLEQPGLAGDILAGPWHPAFGTMARSRAIFLWMRDRLRETGLPGRVLLPRRVSGEFWGISGELAPWYARLGLSRRMIGWHDEAWMECIP